MSVTLHTSHGELKIELFCEATPKAAEVYMRLSLPRKRAIIFPICSKGFSPECQNFLALCASNYYDGCIFHRNIKNFMIQTGDPSGTGKGGDSIWGGPFNDEIRPTIKFNSRGMVAMANNGSDQNKSQFFIAYSKQPHLDSKYTIFGRVIDGADDALSMMEKVPVNAKNRPLEPITLEKITIHANPFAK